MKLPRHDPIFMAILFNHVTRHRHAKPNSNYIKHPFKCRLMNEDSLAYYVLFNNDRQTMTNRGQRVPKEFCNYDGEKETISIPGWLANNLKLVVKEPIEEDPFENLPLSKCSTLEMWSKKNKRHIH